MAKSPYRWNRERHVTAIAFPVERTTEPGTLKRLTDFGHLKVLTGTGEDLVTVTFKGEPLFTLTAQGAKELGLTLIVESDRVAS
jgi:hypothetical protein